MTLSSSSISSSEAQAPAAPSQRARWRGVVRIVLWTVLFLALADVAINVLFSYRPDASGTRPSALQMYFEYGRSTEGKLRRMVIDARTLTPMGAAGWLENPQRTATLPTAPRDDSDLFIAAYGMSFLAHVCDAMEQGFPNITLRMRSSPSAPLNHSYAVFRDEFDAIEPNVAVIGVLASSLKGMQSVTHATWQFEGPAAYTFPRYVMAAGGGVDAIEPPMRSAAKFSEAVRDAAKWRQYVDWLQQHDASYNRWVFDESLLDHSAIVRMIRRAYADRHERQISERVHDGDGFVLGCGTVEVAGALLVDFAQRCRQRGCVPIVLLIHDKGYGDDLYRALGPTLDAHDVPYISTHTIAPASDRRNFVADGHFTPENDERIGRAVMQRIRAERAQLGSSGTGVSPVVGRQAKRITLSPAAK